jgi:hypothetical protein
MIKIKEIYLTAWIMLIGGMVYVQDPHFYQYFSSPLTLNPANTGNFDGPYQVAAFPVVGQFAIFDQQLQIIGRCSLVM